MKRPRCASRGSNSPPWRCWGQAPRRPVWRGPPPRRSTSPRSSTTGRRQALEPRAPRARSGTRCSTRTRTRARRSTFPAGVIHLTGSALTITASATITGAGAGGSGTVLQQQPSSGARVLTVEANSGQVAWPGPPSPTTPPPAAPGGTEPLAPGATAACSWGWRRLFRIGDADDRRGLDDLRQRRGRRPGGRGAGRPVGRLEWQRRGRRRAGWRHRDAGDRRDLRRDNHRQHRLGGRRGRTLLPVRRTATRPQATAAASPPRWRGRCRSPTPGRGQRGDRRWRGKRRRRVARHGRRRRRPLSDLDEQRDRPHGDHRQRHRQQGEIRMVGTAVASTSTARPRSSTRRSRATSPMRARTSRPRAAACSPSAR